MAIIWEVFHWSRNSPVDNDFENIKNKGRDSDAEPLFKTILVVPSIAIFVLFARLLSSGKTSDSIISILLMLST